MTVPSGPPSEHDVDGVAVAAVELERRVDPLLADEHAVDAAAPPAASAAGSAVIRAPVCAGHDSSARICKRVREVGRIGAGEAAAGGLRWGG